MIYDETLNLYIDVEIDEPYDGYWFDKNGKKIEISFTNDNDLDRLLEIMNIKIN